MSKWDELSMAEKAEMMKVAVRQGITNLSDIKQKYNEFAEGGSKEEEEEVNTIIPFTQRREVIITPDSEYNHYLNTLPDNQRFTPNDKYDSYFYWKLNGRPRNFEEAYNKGMFHYDHSDNAYHANSIAFDDNTGVGYFMKPKTHDTVGYELDWFNKGLVTEEGGKQRPVTPEEAKEREEFRKNYFLTNDPDRPNYYRYQPIEKAEGGGIHIKPSHRGRLTALKKRTGKTEAELYNDGNPAHKKMVVFARNSRKWKHGLGGNLFDGTSQPTQQMQVFSPYYDYTVVGHPLTRNVLFPEITIIPDSKFSPAERNYKERQRQRNLPDYAEHKDRELTSKQIAQTQKEWENSFEKQALDYGQAVASGIGMGADIVSRLPIYSSLKGASTLSRAETPLDYAESAMWLTPIVGATYQAAKPIAQKAANEAAFAWAFRNPEISNVFSDLHPVTKKAEINTSTNKPVFIRWGNDERFMVQPSAEVYNDIVNQLKEAKSYRTSSGYKELVNRFTKESRDKGIDFSESLFDGNNKSLSKLTVSNREAGHLGEYYPTTNSIDLDLAQIGDMPVPFHEGIHWQRIGFPADRIGPKFEKWLEARKTRASNEMQLFEEFRNSPEYTRYYQRKAADKAIQDKVDEALYSFADETLRNKGELQAYGLEAGKAIGIQPFSEYPGMIDALDAIEKARKYSPQLRGIKSGGEENVRRFWDILTGNYVPVTLPIALGSYKYTSKNK